MKLLMVSFFIFSQLSLFGASPSIKGRVEIKFDNDIPYSPPNKRAYDFYVKIFFRRGAEGKDYCPGKFGVDPDTFTFVANVTQYCNAPEFYGKELFIELKCDCGFPPTWTIKSIPKITFTENRENWSEINILIQIPLKLSNNQKGQNLCLGEKAFSDSPNHSLLFFDEATRGNDLKYTVAAVNFLEGNKRQDLAYHILKSKDFSKMDIDTNTKFKLLMRRANAARAANEPLEALSNYASAQQIYPFSPQPVSIAYTVVKDDLRVTGLTPLIQEIGDNIILNESFWKVYQHWKAKDKPQFETVLMAMKTADWVFASENITVIEEKK